jgi:group I intron endonuclease
MSGFYVYILCDPRKPGKYVYGEILLSYQPFYVGKGKGRRAWRHSCYIGKHHNPHKDRIIQKLLDIGKSPTVVIIKDTLSEERAFTLEKKIICLIGRFNLGEGPLTNVTEGGEGISGYVWDTEQRSKITGEARSGKNNPFFGKNHSEETKKLMHEIHRDTTGVNNSFYGKQHSKETKALISKKNAGRKRGVFSENHRNLISSALMGKPKQLSPESIRIANQKRLENFRRYGHPTKRVYAVSTPAGETLEIRNLKAWCRNSGVNYHMLLYVAHGRYNDWSGYRCAIKETV